MTPGYGTKHQAERERRLVPDRMLVPVPGPDEVALAVCAADGARASVVVSRATLTETGITPLLEGLEITQAEVRARKEAG